MNRTITKRYIKGVWAFFVGCWYFLGTGWSSGWVQAADVEQSVKLYQKGYAAFANGEHRMAIQWFRASQQELPKLERYQKTRVELDRLIGISLYHLREFKASYSLLDSYLRSPSRRKNKVPEVQKIWLELRSRLGLTVSQTSPPVERRIVVPDPRPPVERKPPVEDVRVVTPPRVPPPTSRRPHSGAWTVATLGIATLGVAVVMGVVAQQNMNGVQERYNRLVPLPDREAQAISQSSREALTQSTVANVLYVGGGVLTLTGTVLLFTWFAPN